MAMWLAKVLSWVGDNVVALGRTATPVIADPWFTFLFGIVFGLAGNFVTSIYVSTRWQDWADRKRHTRSARAKVHALRRQLGHRAAGIVPEGQLGTASLEQLNAWLRSLNSRLNFVRAQDAVRRADMRSRDDARVRGLDHAGSGYALDELAFVPSGQVFSVACPRAIQDEVLKKSPKYQFRSDCSFDGSSRFDDLAVATGIPTLPSLIRKHAEVVGRRIERSLETTRPIFNNVKFGIGAVHFERHGAQERPGLRVETFETDYFTHLVFRAIYHELRATGHAISRVTEAELGRYKPFLTSFGVNTFVILGHGDARSLVFSKRSRLVANTRAALKWHATMNEGLSLTDFDIDLRSASLFKCLDRGLWEELGLARGRYGEAKFYDVFLELDNLELGITSTVVVPMDLVGFEDAASKAPDRHFETVEFAQIEYSEGSIAHFLELHRGMVTGVGAYAARLLAARGCPY